jgi:hypothetical protein
MSRPAVDTCAIAAIWVIVLSGVVLLGMNPDDDPTTDDVGVGVALAGLIGLTGTALYVGARRRRLGSYVSRFVVPAVLSWWLASTFVGGFGNTNSNTRAGLLLWPVLFGAWLVLQRNLPAPRGGLGWQTFVIFLVGLMVGNLVSNYVTTNDVAIGLAIGGTWFGLHLARLAHEAQTAEAGGLS